MGGTGRSVAADGVQAADQEDRPVQDSHAAAGAAEHRLPPVASKPSVTLHYDPSRDIVLRYECVGERSVKSVILVVYFVVTCSLALFILVIVLQLTYPPTYFLENEGMIVANTVFASLLTMVTLATLWQFLRRLRRSNQCGKRWTHRRRRLAAMAGTELGLQVINSIMFLVPNSYVLARQCSWFSSTVTWTAGVRWTTWNSAFLLYWIEGHSWMPAPRNSRWYVERGEEWGAPVVMDAPFWRHWPKACLWVGLVVSVSIITSRNLRAFNEEVEALGPSCRYQTYACNVSGTITGLIVGLTLCIASYSLLYFYSISRAFQHLLRQPYNSFRMANFVLRIQIRQRTMAIAFFFLCMVCYTFIGFSTCRSYVLTWLGYLPSMLVMVWSGISNGYSMTPKRPHDDGILRVWLQEFAWTEGEEEQRKKAARASSLPPDSLSTVAIDKEPIFCFETGLKAMYWSMLVYDHDEAPDSPYSVEAALNLYDLQHFEMHWDKDPTGVDTKAIVGWNNDMAVIAFRGTASLANAKADIQVWRTAWPPGLGSQWVFSTPMVHWGFHKAWTANDFCHRILGWLEQRLHPSGDAGEAAPSKPLRVLITGHSLGGALATLCAYDIASRYPDTAVAVKCYTFGAPRTGNHAFAKLYDKTVPDTWQMINSDDVVTRAGKFLVLYKRPGLRVLINQLGDMVVRPNYVESVIRRVPGGASVRDHLLTSYQVALASVLGAQFSSKRFATGREGVLSLAQRKGGPVVLDMVGLAQEPLAILQEHGWEALLELRRRTKQGRQLLPGWARHKALASDQSLQEVVLVGADSGLPAAAQGAAGEQEVKLEESVTAGELPPQLQRGSSLVGQLLKRASLATSRQPSGLQRILTTRGPVHDRSGASPFDLAAEEEGRMEAAREVGAVTPGQRSPRLHSLTSTYGVVVAFVSCSTSLSCSHCNRLMRMLIIQLESANLK